ncbi:single-stranded DNA-binding protein-like [Ylistrum balloti]|uniref:single-stranded DNA-binding protein-like n=1 Tax=Ylistrum balloti TaxID=509963 RepID=UPI002905EEA3|nr:single-stranded DNA-binding protein-like [Ylistrum balloti]
MSLNRVTLIGNLGGDPEVRVTQSGTKVANLRVATNERWQDRDGNTQEHTEWHRVVFYNKLADICEQYLGRGRRVCVEGSIRTNKWQDRDGNDRYTTEIRGRNMIMLDGRGDATASGGGYQSGSTSDFSSTDAGTVDIGDDDIPF